MSRSSRALASVLALSLAALTACDDSTNPDGLDPNDFVGVFALEPSLTATCDLGDFGDVTITIDTVEITDADEDSVWLRMPVTAETDLGNFSDDAEFALAHDLSDEQFGGQQDLDMDIPAGITTVHATGTVELNGEFENTDSFTADVTSDVSLAVGAGAAQQCSAINTTVTGTRVD